MNQDSLNLSDSVVMGDININSGQHGSGIVECPTCGTQGVPVKRCTISGCENRFCDSCLSRWRPTHALNKPPICEQHTHSQQEAEENRALEMGITPIGQSGSGAHVSLPSSLIRAPSQSAIDNSHNHVTQYVPPPSGGILAFLGSGMGKVTILLVAAAVTGVFWLLLS